jgi:hypothetical protein
MAEEGEELKTCEECGATIYPEHIKKGMAEAWEGRLLCVHCLKDKRAATGVAEGDAPVALDEGGPGGEVAVAYDKKPTAIRSFGSRAGGITEVAGVNEAHLRRALLRDVPNATRCRVFHCKLADAAMNYMCEQINDWADANEDVQIKFATSCIGVVEGKHADPHLIVTVFY